MLFNVSVKSCCCDMIILSCVFYVGLGAGSLDISEGLMLLAVSRAPVNLTRLHMTLRIPSGQRRRYADPYSCVVR